MVLVLQIQPRLLQSERALSRGHWNDLADGFRAALHSASMRTVLVAWGIASLAMGAATVSEIFLAKNTFSAGDFGYGLLYASIGCGLVLGSFASASAQARWGVAPVYGVSLALVGAGYFGAGVSPNVWVAAVCCAVSGVGNGAAITCNALLVQRGTFDLLRGRALTFVMSSTYVLVGIGEVLGGVLVHHTGPRWIWVVAGVALLVAGVAGWLMARNLGGEVAAEAERARPQEPTTPVAAAN
jgi:MFS family permease